LNIDGEVVPRDLVVDRDHNQGIWDGKYTVSERIGKDEQPWELVPLSLLVPLPPQAKRPKNDPYPHKLIGSRSERVNYESPLQ